MTDKYVLIINKDFKGKVVSKRKEFMDLLIRVLGDNNEAKDELAFRFGTKVAGSYNSSNSITVLSDGDVIFKD